MKKFLALILCLSFGLTIVGCGGDSDGGTTPTPPPASPSSAVKTTGSLKLEIVSASLAKDTSDADAVIVTYKFENGTSKKQNFKFAVGTKVKQGDETLTPAVVAQSDNYDPSLVTKNIENGTSLEVKVAYLLSDTTTPLDVTCTPQSGEDKNPITLQLTLE